MADDTAPNLTAQQPTIVNGFNSLAAATASPAATTPTTQPAAQPQPPATAPPAQPPPAAPPTPPQPAAGPQDAPPYTRNPHLLPEHALLGSLLHAPAAFTDLAAFLNVEDFATPHTRAVYATLRGLHRSGALFDVAAMPTHAQQLHAANENHLRLFTALRATPPPFTTITVTNIPKLIAQLNAAAPAETLPYRGVYDPAAQLHLGRLVLEDSLRRQLHTLGVELRRAHPATPNARTPNQAAPILATNLQQIHNQLDAMTQRLQAAVQRTNPTTATAAASTSTGQGRHRNNPGRQWRLPDQLRPISAPLRHRAERHILHLALHAGRLHDIPQEILNIPADQFSTTRHANLWRTIKDLHARGLPVNYVSVFLETKTPGFTHDPMPTDRTLTRMAEVPDIRPTHIARSLRTIISAALSRTNHNPHAMSNVASNTTTPLATALAETKHELDALTATNARAPRYQPPTHTAGHGRHHRQ